jgi:hypothetical protein
VLELGSLSYETHHREVPMSEEANCALVRREAFNAGNFDPVNEPLSPGYVHHDPTTQEFGSGIEGFKRLMGYYREAFPDLESGSTTSSLPATASWIAGPGEARTRES